MKVYSFTESDLTELANQVRRAVVNSLETEGLITTEQNNKFMSTHIVTIAEKIRLFPWFRKAKDNDNLGIYVSKLPYEVKDEPLGGG